MRWQNEDYLIEPSSRFDFSKLDTYDYSFINIVSRDFVVDFKNNSQVLSEEHFLLGPKILLVEQQQQQIAKLILNYQSSRNNKSSDDYSSCAALNGKFQEI